MNIDYIIVIVLNNDHWINLLIKYYIISFPIVVIMYYIVYRPSREPEKSEKPEIRQFC